MSGNINKPYMALKQWKIGDMSEWERDGKRYTSRGIVDFINSSGYDFTFDRDALLGIRVTKFNIIKKNADFAGNKRLENSF
ncbi:hypothetical protein HN997_02095 [archaeon]|nr:hypothetical protein [archaeon]MBT6956061.1 hypothetical protein [archaeon]